MSGEWETIAASWPAICRLALRFHVMRRTAVESTPSPDAPPRLWKSERTPPSSSISWLQFRAAFETVRVTAALEAGVPNHVFGADEIVALLG